MQSKASSSLRGYFVATGKRGCVLKAFTVRFKYSLHYASLRLFQLWCVSLSAAPDIKILSEQQRCPCPAPPPSWQFPKCRIFLMICALSYCQGLTFQMHTLLFLFKVIFTWQWNVPFSLRPVHINPLELAGHSLKRNCRLGD